MNTGTNPNNGREGLPPGETSWAHWYYSKSQEANNLCSIYVDDDSHDIQFINNSAINCQTDSLFIHDNQNLLFQNNFLFGSPYGVVFEEDPPKNITSNRIIILKLFPIT